MGPTPAYQLTLILLLIRQSSTSNQKEWLTFKNLILVFSFEYLKKIVFSFCPHVWCLTFSDMGTWIINEHSFHSSTKLNYLHTFWLGQLCSDQSFLINHNVLNSTKDQLKEFQIFPPLFDFKKIKIKLMFHFFISDNEWGQKFN